MKKGGLTNASRETFEHFRVRAVELRENGWKVNKISEAFGIHEGSVSRWLGVYRKGGKEALKRRKAKGNSPKLSIKDKEKVLKALEKSATEYGFSTSLWTCKRVSQLIKNITGKSLHFTKVWMWLKRWGLTSQKPKKVAKQKDEKESERWLKEEWPKIKAHRRRWQAILYFQDESGVSLTAVFGKTWAPKGKTPIVKVTGNRGGLCVTSAITPDGRMLFRIEKKRVNSEEHINFIKQILKHHPNRKVIIVEDNAPCHKAKKVKKFLGENKKRLAIYNIPPYSPELNPDEHVWAYLKAHQLKSHQAQNTAELKKLVKNKMQGIQRKQGLVNSFFMQSILT